MNAGASKIVVVDDDPMFRERLVELINRAESLEVRGQADNAVDALALVQGVDPDLLVLDLTLRGSSGLRLIKRIRVLGLKVAILAVSAHDEALCAQRVLHAGAGGYFMKIRGSDEILIAIRKVLAGQIYISSKTSYHGKSASECNSQAKYSWSRLADREIEVVRLIGMGRTTKEIAEDLGLGIPSIDTYKARIKGKLKLRNAVELQHFAVRWFLDTEQEL